MVIALKPPNLRRSAKSVDRSGFRDRKKAAYPERASGRYEDQRHIFIDASAKDMDAGGLGVIDHRMGIASHRLSIAVSHHHRRTGGRKSDIWPFLEDGCRIQDGSVFGSKKERGIDV
jgi:hypothetical protein